MIPAHVRGTPCKPPKGSADLDPVPSDYEDLLGYYTHRGFRVIACATKHLQTLGWKEVKRMTRKDAESNLEFLGFIIFENKLKDATAEIIEELNEALIRNIMCTGDNILTAISVARECGLIDHNAHVFIPHFDEGILSRKSRDVSDNLLIKGNFADSKAMLKWQSIDNALFELDQDTLMVNVPSF